MQESGSRTCRMQIYDIPIGPDSRETTRHGSILFPLAVYHTVMSRNVLGYVNWHWHEEMQLCLVTEGSVLFAVNQCRYPLKAGQGIFIGSQFLHMAKPVNAWEGAYLCLDFSPKLLGFFEGSILDQKYVRPYLGAPELSGVVLDPAEEWQRFVLEAARRICLLHKKQPFGYEYECGTLLRQLWLKLIQNVSAADKSPSARSAQENARLQLILEYLDEHFGEAVTLAGIAGHAALSASECCRFFKRMTGETIFSYLQAFRLSKGLEQLQNSTASVSEVAYNAGFCSTSYFIEVFKRHMNMTPLQYRKAAGGSLSRP